MGKIRQPLAEKILENSVSKHLPTAIKEWQTISKIHNEIDGSIRCLCGQPGIKDWYELENVHNGKVLIHIGANCITYFTAATDFLPADSLKKLGKLKQTAKEDEEPIFTKTHFPQSLINYLWENDVFSERPENNFHAYADYKRFNELIHKGGRRASHSPEEYAELTTLWQDFIKPFLLDQPRKELHLETLDHSSFAYQKRIQELENQVAQLQAQLTRRENTAKTRINNSQPNTPEKKTSEHLAPSSYKAIQTITRRRKNKRHLLPSDFNQELLEYFLARDFIQDQDYRKLKTAMSHQNYTLNDYLRKEINAILIPLTETIKKDKSS
ncbi:hypothetical protein [Streptococcus saliviloxodontae]|uniref:Relaxase n=1 Tax=Streptococcus saliviloxodontae TaxID=1349416 RepID=A0ABS2PIW6_9STRE|nr:hypothetical protein [Streptococcus saliviloxodontae]MBM7635375.1 hypothetical protein [Streptococcus saliviloxodontae]